MIIVQIIAPVLAPAMLLLAPFAVVLVAGALHSLFTLATHPVHTLVMLACFFGLVAVIFAVIQGVSYLDEQANAKVYSADEIVMFTERQEQDALAGVVVYEDGAAYEYGIPAADDGSYPVDVSDAAAVYAALGNYRGEPLSGTISHADADDVEKMAAALTSSGDVVAYAGEADGASVYVVRDEDTTDSDGIDIAGTLEDLAEKHSYLFAW